MDHDNLGATLRAQRQNATPEPGQGDYEMQAHPSSSPLSAFDVEAGVAHNTEGRQRHTEIAVRHERRQRHTEITERLAECGEFFANFSLVIGIVFLGILAVSGISVGVYYATKP
ncbi:hypothetical protein DFJ58DRAFT_728894 [Suillus subalutaceus]|uniref:uncharacterized protein n=1 Tax=Suillus subalutaceus TaxID=48586 RepID=UPI001B86D5CD|nr:uncharacterized protein DFJ58DRAFT_728894 [Suillus subalutaceus]KAG1851443.1 hypothetical protein DFJ58DRAFT_728894 [Suillus subalutaceus]